MSDPSGSPDPRAARIAVAERAYAAFNAENWEVLGQVLATDIVLERAAGLGRVEGAGALEDFAAPDAFDWQRLEPLGEYAHHGDRMLVALRGRVRGSGSSAEVEQPVFHVVTFRELQVARIAVFFDRAAAEAALRR